MVKLFPDIMKLPPVTISFPSTNASYHFTLPTLGVAEIVIFPAPHREALMGLEMLGLLQKEIITRFPIPEMATATKIPLP